MRTPGFARRALERLCRGRSLRRHLGQEFGGSPIVVSPDAALHYLRPGPIRSVLTRVAERFIAAGQEVWDLGANVGVFSLAAASRGAKVLAVEPDPFLADLIRRTSRLEPNRGFRIDVLSVAIASRFDLAEFTIAARGRASNSLADVRARSTSGGVRTRLTVPVLTLDMLASVRRPPDFLKVDVEGAELQVLEGGRAVLEDHRPILWIEVDRERQSEATQALRSVGYRFYECKGTLGPGEITEVASCVFDTLAVPEERAARTIDAVASE